MRIKSEKFECEMKQQLIKKNILKFGSILSVVATIFHCIDFRKFEEENKKTNSHETF
jgi:hypothetical protein